MPPSGFEAASFVAIWQLLRVALHVDDWFVVATSQLAGNALGRIVPGGMAAAGALQYRMLTRVGVAGGSVASGITASSALSFATLLALPVLAVPAILAGAPVDRGLLQSLWVGLAAFVLLVAVGVAAFAFDRPLHAVGRHDRVAAQRYGAATEPRVRPAGAPAVRAGRSSGGSSEHGGARP